MIARLCFVCLALSCVFFYALSFFIPAFEDLLAQDALRAASDAVHEAMFSLFEDHLGAPFEQPHALLDNNLHQQSPTNTLDEPTRSVEKRQVGICRTLAGKRMTMIGGEHVYRLHLLFLRHRERAEGKSFPCPYHEFCTHHHICLPSQRFRDRDDVPLPRYIKSPTTQELVETESAVVNYIVSDTLFSARNESSWEYTLPFVDPATGTRSRETYWLAAARKASVVVLARGPLSAPGQTYTGNWSFLRHVPDYVDKSRAPIANDDDDAMSQMSVPRPLEILNAAVHLTISRFLPDLVQLLLAVRREVRPTRRKRLIWSSSWYHLPGRGSARTALLRQHLRSSLPDMIRQTFSRPRRSSEHVLALQLSAFIHAHVTNTIHLEDPWSLLFNAQGEDMNMLLRKLLPRHGITFLPLDASWARSPEHGHERSHSTIDVDRERMAAIEEAFLTGLEHIVGYLE